MPSVEISVSASLETARFGTENSSWTKPPATSSAATRCFPNEIRIRGRDGHEILDKDDPSKILNEVKKHVAIGAHSWIGQGVHLLKNARFPANTIIAAAQSSPRHLRGIHDSRGRSRENRQTLRHAQDENLKRVSLKQKNYSSSL